MELSHVLYCHDYYIFKYQIFISNVHSRHAQNIQHSVEVIINQNNNLSLQKSVGQKTDTMQYTYTLNN